MKICVKGEFGEFQWELPEEISKHIDEMLKDKPEEFQRTFLLEIEKQLSSYLQLQIAASLTMSCGQIPMAIVQIIMNQGFAEIHANLSDLFHA